MSVALKRSDLFPVGTSVGAYPIATRHYNAVRPSGAATESATVDAAGTLTFAALPEGIYDLYAVVGGVGVNLQLGNVAQPEIGTLKERIETLRTELGC